MQLHLTPDRAPLAVPRYAWLGVALALFTAVGALPVGWMLVTDPSGAGIGLPASWIAATPFGDYRIPGIYLFAFNGLGMLAVAGLAVRRHALAPWLMAVLGVGLVIWIAVQLVVMPETSALQAIFGAIGVVLAGLGLAWLRAAGLLSFR